MESSRQSNRPWRALSRGQRWGLVVSLLVALYTIFGFFILPVIVRNQLEEKLSLALQRQTEVAQVRCNPFTLQVEINGLQVKARQGDGLLAAFDALQVNLQASSLLRLAAIVKSISLVNPQLNLALYKDLTWNFSDLLAQPGETEGGTEGAASPGEKKNFHFSLNNIEISGGQFHLDDQAGGMTHSITALNLAFPRLSNLPSHVEIFTQPSFSAVVNGTPIGMEGDSKPFHASRQSDLNLNFTDIDLTKYLVYLPDNLGFALESGLLDLTLSCSLMQHADGKPAINVKGALALRQVDIRTSDGQPLLAFPSLTVDIDKAHLLRKEVHLAKIHWQQPALFIKRQADGILNLSGLLPPGPEDKTALAPAPSPPADPPLITLGQGLIERARLTLVDQGQAEPFETVLTPVDLSLKGYSSAANSKATYALALTSEAAEEIRVKGSFTSLPLALDGDLSLAQIKLAKYRPYLRESLTVDLTAEELNLQSSFAFAPDREIMLLSRAGLEASKLTLAPERGQEKITIARLAISESTIDLTKRDIVVGQCLSSGGHIPIFRRSDGSLNLLEFLAPRPAGEGKDRGAKGQQDGEKKEDSQGAGPWRFTLADLALRDYATIFTDQQPQQPATFRFEELQLTASNISTVPKEQGKGELTTRLNDTATFKAHGSLALNPLALDLQLALNKLPLKAAQPYLAGNTRAIIAGGRLGGGGRLTVTSQAAEELAFSFKGKAGSSNFSLLDGEAERLLAWQGVDLTGIDLQGPPLRLSLDGVELAGLRALVSLDKEGRSNLSKLSTQPSPAKKEGQKKKKKKGAAAQAMAVQIKQVTIANSRVDFHDQQLSPPFSASLGEIGGTVTGLSSGRDVLADVNIAAKLNRFSPLRVTGTIHPWQEFSTDLQVSLQDMGLPPMSPYSIKFIGYPLTKGKLSLDLHYDISGKRLTSENRAFIDQLTLGELVENDTATSLPVPLAISLLKKRNGEIKLDIPVSGRLDDPKFSVGGVIVTVLENLLIKAATSPFALLGSLFPEGQDFLHAEFSPGSAQPLDKKEEQWQAFAKAMYDHPALKLEVTGFFDPVQDRAALRQMDFDRQLRRQKLKEVSRQQGSDGAQEELRVEPEEYERYLEMAYKAATFKRPRNFIGILKKQEPAEMARLINEHIVISDDELLQLGQTRALAIKEYLVSTGPIEPERVFLLQAKESEPHGDAPPLRVEIVAK
ncbi:MAG: DUF748 domain-containing protein [Thermodesulfobacteriota bacterium]